MIKLPIKGYEDSVRMGNGQILYIYENNETVIKRNSNLNRFLRLVKLTVRGDE